MVDCSPHALHKFAPTLIVGCSPTETEPAAQSAVDRTEKPSSVTADTLANKAPNPEAGLAKLNVGPTLKLLEPGEAPRKLLRHVFSENSKHKLTVDCEWKIDAAIGVGLHLASPMPNLRYKIVAVAETTSDDGSTRFNLTVTDVALKSVKGVEPAQTNLVKKAAALVEGSKGSFVLESNGVVSDIDLSPPSNASPRVFNMIDHIVRGVRLASLPLPAEPIGKGSSGRWFKR